MKRRVTYAVASVTRPVRWWWHSMQCGYVVGFLRTKARLRRERGTVFEGDAEALEQAAYVLEHERAAWRGESLTLTAGDGSGT